MIAGLQCGRSKALEVKDAGEKGRGVFALEHIPKGAYVTEYKYHKLYPARDRQMYEGEYEKNQELCYVLDVYIEGKKACMDATRRLYSLGRYVWMILLDQVYCIYVLGTSTMVLRLM